MKISQRRFLGILIVAVAAVCLSVHAKPPLSEDELIAQLSSTDASKVADALQKIEKQYPLTTKALPTIKGLLNDDRVKVKRKAARVLGSLHSEVSEADVKAICTLLSASDPETITDGLKALRGLKAPSAVPFILPVLDNPKVNVVRDACRTLAVLGDKSIVPKLEPLLQRPEPALQKDAQDAIYALKAKP